MKNKEYGKIHGPIENLKRWRKGNMLNIFEKFPNNHVFILKKFIYFILNINRKGIIQTRKLALNYFK